jgi:hypothetical protein
MPSAQIFPICTLAGLPQLDPKAAPNGGSLRDGAGQP